MITMVPLHWHSALNQFLVPGCLLEEGVFYEGKVLPNGHIQMDTYNRPIHITLVLKRKYFVFVVISGIIHNLIRPRYYASFQ